MAQITDIYELILSTREAASLDYNDVDKEIIVNGAIDSWSSSLANQQLIFDTRKNGQQIVLSKDGFDFSFYWTFDEFISEARKTDLDRDILIFENYRLLKFDCGSSKVYDGKSELRDYIFTNARVYFDSVDFFKKHSNSEDESKEFVDYYSSTTRKVIFASNSNGRKVQLPIPKAGVLKMSRDVDYRDVWNSFVESFDPANKNFPLFLKSSIVAQLSDSNENLYVAFFKRLENILKEANLNYSIYLNEISINKLKQEYKEYKDTYFEHINSLLGKIVNQVVALPITFVGASFAVGKVSDSFLYLAIIIALAVASVYVIFLIYHYKEDLSFLESSFSKDYIKIEDSNFFIENPEELDEFEVVKKRMESKLSFVRRFLNSYYWVTIVFNVFLIGFVLSKLEYSQSSILISLGFLVLVSFLYFVFYLNKYYRNKSLDK